MSREAAPVTPGYRCVRRSSYCLGGGDDAWMSGVQLLHNTVTQHLSISVFNPPSALPISPGMTCLRVDRVPPWPQLHIIRSSGGEWRWWWWMKHYLSQRLHKEASPFVTVLVTREVIYVLRLHGCGRGPGWAVSIGPG